MESEMDAAGGIDPAYECDAPMYFDFARVAEGAEEQINSPADRWFERRAAIGEHTDDPVQVPQPLLEDSFDDELSEESEAQDQSADAPQQTAETSTAGACDEPTPMEIDVVPVLAPAVSAASEAAPVTVAVTEQTPAEVPAPTEPPKPTNVVTSWAGAGAIKSAFSNAAPSSKAPAPERKRRSTSPAPAVRSQPKRAKTDAPSTMSSLTRPTAASMARAAQKAKPPPATAAAAALASKVPVKKATPEEKKAAPAPHVTAEDKELERIEAARMQMAKERQAAADKLHANKKKSPTRPRSFSFASDARARSRSSSRASSRQASPTPSDRAPSRAMSERSVPSTPKRLLASPRAIRPQSEKIRRAVGAPKLRTAARARPTQTLSSEERERLELLAMPKFRAAPVNPRVIDSHGDVGVPRVPKRSVTKAHTPKFTSDKRAVARRPAAPAPAPQPASFKAHPLNHEILEHVVGVPEKCAPPVTVAESPCLRTRQRAESEMPAEGLPLDLTVVGEALIIRSCSPIPADAPVQLPPKPPVHVTAPEPFHFDEEIERRKAERRAKEEAERLMQEAAAREFHARPMPVGSPVLPPKQAKPATQPEPFNLQSEKRHIEYVSEWANKVAEQMAEEEARFSAFRAQPLPEGDPFIPAKSTMPLTETAPFNLETDARADQRSEFDAKNRERIAHEEAERARMEALKAEEERAQIAELRKQIVHHPEPIRRYRPIEIQPSDKKLTEPHSPAIGDKRVRRSGQMRA